MGLRPTRILLIEDQESEYLLTKRMLSTIEGQAFELEWAPSYPTGLAAILRAAHDVCLLDYKINNSDGLEILRESQKSACKAPVIILTAMGDYRLDVEAMQLGAADLPATPFFRPTKTRGSFSGTRAPKRSSAIVRRRCSAFLWSC